MSYVLWGNGMNRPVTSIGEAGHVSCERNQPPLVFSDLEELIDRLRLTPAPSDTLFRLTIRRIEQEPRYVELE